MFGNPVSGLIVELLIYVFVDRELKDEKLKELISSSRYSDNINVRSMNEEEFKERCRVVVDGFSKFSSFFKKTVEPWSQICDDNKDAEKEENVTVMLGYLWNFETDTLTGTMEPAFISKKRGMSRNAELSDAHENDNLIT